VKFLGDRLQHLGHGQGDSLGVIEIVGPPGTRDGLTVGFRVLDEVVVAAAQQVFVVAQQGYQVVHPGIEPGPAAFKSSIYFSRSWAASRYLPEADGNQYLSGLTMKKFMASLTRDYRPRWWRTGSCAR